MNDFDYDLVQKKRLARQARFRKCGSKSRKCSLISDQLTPKQWRERCGDVVSYQLGKPMGWEQFKQLPKHIQKLYIDGLMEQFYPTATDLSKVFGATAQTIAKYLGKEFGIRFYPGKLMPKDRLSGFQLFLGNAEQQEETVQQEPEPRQEELLIETQFTRESDMAMTEFSLSFDGMFDPRMIHNSIASMLPDGTNVQIEIHCTILA